MDSASNIVETESGKSQMAFKQLDKLTNKHLEANIG
jgi:hypothetical protein